MLLNTFEMANLPKVAVTMDGYPIEDVVSHMAISPELANFLTNCALVLCVLTIAYLIYRLFEQLICKLFVKVKKEQVTVTKVHFNMRGRRTIEVKIEGKKRKRTFTMPCEGYDVGMQGILSHKGRFGVAFEKTGDLRAENTADYHQPKYHVKNTQA